MVGGPTSRRLASPVLCRPSGRGGARRRTSGRAAGPGRAELPRLGALRARRGRPAPHRARRLARRAGRQAPGAGVPRDPDDGYHRRRPLGLRAERRAAGAHPRSLRHAPRRVRPPCGTSPRSTPRVPDPWGHLRRPYERAKRRATLRAIGPGPLNEVAELGCGNGVPSDRPAPHCGRLPALEVVPAAAPLARRRPRAEVLLTVAPGGLADALPDAAPDLLVLSEVFDFPRPRAIDPLAFGTASCR